MYNDRFAIFGIGCVESGYVDSSKELLESIGAEFILGYGVRPVISLKSNITIEQLEKITGEEEDDWPGHILEEEK